MFPTIQKDALIDADPATARAALIAKLRGDSAYLSLRDDMKALAARNQATLTGGSQAVRSHLADQIPLLEAVSLRFFSDAAKAGNSNARQSLASVGLNAQKVLIASLLALHRTYQDEADFKALPVQHTRAD
jgi:hypothetical protein